MWKCNTPQKMKELKEKEERRQIRLQINKKLRAARKEKYNSVSLETRREFIRLCHAAKSGQKISDIGKLAGIDDRDVAHEIYIRNHKKVTHHVLKQPEEVK